ncbi:MAG: 16S rRNA (cytosine(1402)-N(4))-methyltransferase RsmH [Lachnospiraceae bacterium]|nr:16S rRNA (cytosine(1402)-N(4))-methyltransferase RsmH [Lachnospiraceae bacterium]
MEFYHLSVLLNETIESLNIKPCGIYVDGTTGGGGHSFEIAKRLGKKGRLICIDKDLEAIDAASEKLSIYKDKITFVHDNYSNIKNILLDLNIPGIDGALIDAGVSSKQLDEADRGFSYMLDAPLDMRMDKTSDFKAYDVVNTYSQKELENIIFKYGEENWAKRIAEFIVREREEKPVNTTYELVDIIKKAVPKGARRDGPHPAKRTFQAIRIEVNGELSSLEEAVYDMTDLLNDKGIISVITFHSLEDRIVKTAFKTMENPCICPPDFPVCVCNRLPKGRILTKKPILPSKYEVDNNPRSRSAKLRVFERIVL